MTTYGNGNFPVQILNMFDAWDDGTRMATIVLLDEGPNADSFDVPAFMLSNGDVPVELSLTAL